MKLRLDNNRGFTLIEILVVLALTMLTMGLIFGPLVSSLRMTRSAEIMIRTQDNARFALRQISKDLSDAMYVYDESSENDYVIFKVPNQAGLIRDVHVYNTKVDLILPRMRGYCPVDSSHTPGGIPRGPESSPVCPYVDDKGNRCGADLEMRPIQPLTADTTIVRYFIGLEDPTKPYVNGYLQRLAEAGGDNTYVLYRAEFSLSDRKLFPDNDKWGRPLSPVGKRRLQDFFYNTDPNPVTGTPFCQEWRKISKPIVTLEDVDLISIKYDGSGEPIVTPLVTFKPTAIYNDPLVPTNDGASSPEMADAPPTTYKATYGNWVMPYKVTLTPDPNDPKTIPNSTYETAVEYTATPSPEPVGMGIYRVQAGVSTLVFRIDEYLESRSASIYGAGEMTPGLDRDRAFTVDTVKGTVNCAFPNVIAAQCAVMNSDVGTSAGNSRPLSDYTTADAINKGTLLGVPGTYAINCPAHDSQPDRRILPYSTVVPGSVRVVAPDETKASVSPAASVPLLSYTPVPYLMREPGVNEFSVDIGHDLDFSSSWYGAAALYFHRERNVGAVPPPGTPAQPTVTPGIPPGYVLIYYEVQNNRKGDVLRASYVTKSIMTVMVGIQIWDSGMKKPQIVQFTDKVRLKNMGS